MALSVDQFMCRSDNFGVLLHDPATGETALIDAPEERPILEAIERTSWTPTVILTTHHHPDHVEANLALKERFGLTVVGPVNEQAKIPGIDRAVGGGEQQPRLRQVVADMTGGMARRLDDLDAMAGEGEMIAADTLFALGCGRLLERGPADMHASLKKLAALPPETIVYCGHEYTQANAKFALTVDPDNT